jgi:glycogen debranching enzyme
LPHSPLSTRQQAAVVQTVMEHLLTPMGLRTLSPFDARYRRRYGGSWESRDRAYHQGTVWAWLMGPFIEAHLNVKDNSPSATAAVTGWLEGFNEHLNEAGLGFVSEIFDGDPPHHPRGCIAQAWSVAEVLRAKCLLARLAAGAKAV